MQEKKKYQKPSRECMRFRKEILTRFRIFNRGSISLDDNSSVVSGELCDTS